MKVSITYRNRAALLSAIALIHQYWPEPDDHSRRTDASWPRETPFSATQFVVYFSGDKTISPTTGGTYHEQQ